MDLETIEMLFRCGKFFAITPYSSIRRGTNTFQRCHSFLVFTLYTAGFVNVWYTSRSRYSTMRRIQAFLTVLSILTSYFLNFYILVVVMGLNSDRWHRLIAGLKSIKIPQTNKKLLRILKLVLLIFLLITIFGQSGIFYNFNIGGCLILLPLTLSTYSQFIYSLCACTVLKVLLTRYQHHKNVLVQAVDSKQLVKVLKQIKQGVLTLKRCVNIFNSIFGWTILGSTFSGALSSFVHIDLAIKDETYFANLWSDLGLRLYFLAEIAFLLLLWVIFLLDAASRDLTFGCRWASQLRFCCVSKY
jgi:hypothetical protein